MANNHMNYRSRIAAEMSMPVSKVFHAFEGTSVRKRGREMEKKKLSEKKKRLVPKEEEEEEKTQARERAGNWQGGTTYKLQRAAGANRRMRM